MFRRSGAPRRISPYVSCSWYSLAGIFGEAGEFEKAALIQFPPWRLEVHRVIYMFGCPVAHDYDRRR
jgi:hypothetical protein